MNVTQEIVSLPQEAINIACEWWAEKICLPEFDNGDQSRTGRIAAMMAANNAEHVTVEQRQKFKSELNRIIKNKPIDRFVVSVDYGPDIHLSQAMLEAGIPFENAPWKTTMWFRADSIVASYGYGAPLETLWTRP